MHFTLSLLLLSSCTDHSAQDPSKMTGVVWADQEKASPSVGSSSVAESSSLAVVSASSAADLSSSVVAVSSSSFTNVLVSSSAVALSSSIAPSSSSLPTFGAPGAPLDYKGKIYETTVIGTQTWMAENLNFNPTSTVPDSSLCYNGVAANCTTYGMLYNYTAALNACPNGWHLPDTTEWNTLVATVGGTETAGTKLKAKLGWNSSGNGTDDFGFQALPGGFHFGAGYSIIGRNGGWWTATPNGSRAYARYVGDDIPYVGHACGVDGGLSVRCLKNSP